MTKQEFESFVENAKNAGSYTVADTEFVWDADAQMWTYNGAFYNAIPTPGTSEDETSEDWAQPGITFELVSSEAPETSEESGDDYVEIVPEESHCLIHTEQELIFDEKKGIMTCPICDAIENSDEQIEVGDFIEEIPVISEVPETTDVTPESILADCTAKVDNICDHFDSDWEQYQLDDDWKTNKLKQQYVADYATVSKNLVELLDNVRDIVMAENEDNIAEDRFNRIKLIQTTKVAAKLEKAMDKAVASLSWLRTRIDGKFKIYSKAAYAKALEAGEIETFVY